MIHGFHEALTVHRKRLLILSVVAVATLVVTACDPGPPVRIAISNDTFIPIACNLLPARLITSQGSELGWLFTGPDLLRDESSLSSKPEGDFENQLWQDIVAPASAGSARVLLPLQANTPGATVIIDCVWYRQDKELAREALSASCDAQGKCFFIAALSVPSEVDRLRLIARPWREQDGRVTLSDGVLIWEARALQ